MHGHLERWLAQLRHWWRRRWYPQPLSRQWIADHVREEPPAP